MDPRSGVVVGTMTPATPITTITNPQNISRTVRKKTSIQLNSPATTATSIKLGRTANNSNSLNNTLNRTNESILGGNSSVNKTTNKEVSDVVDLTSDEGNKPQADSKEISFNKLQGKTFPSLVVVARPHLRLKENSHSDRSKLDAKVKSVLMYVPTKFTEW